MQARRGSQRSKDNLQVSQMLSSAGGGDTYPDAHPPWAPGDLKGAGRVGHTPVSAQASVLTSDFRRECCFTRP